MTRQVMRYLITAFILAIVVNGAKADEVTAFLPGERLEYVLKWNGIAAGDSVMEIMDGETVDGISLYRVVSTAKSRSFVDIFYKVRNSYETHIHPLDALTRKYVFLMREGGKRKNRVLVFDQERHIVTRIVREKGQVQSEVYEIPELTHDNLSSLYAMRNSDFKVGDSIPFRVFEGKKNWDLYVDVLAEEEIKVKAGRFRSIKVQPKLKFEGMFRRKGDLFVWLTDDKWHIPVLMKSEVRIGSINAELVSYSLGNGDTKVPAQITEDEE